MSKGTGIQWADDTVNPTSGCDGCELWTHGKGGPCYAGNLHETRLAKSMPQLYAPKFSEVRLIPGRMAKAVRCMDLVGKDRADKPWLSGLRRKIFVGDLGDIFSADVPFEFLKTEIIDNAISAFGARHDLMLLTKQPRRALAFAVWLHEQETAWPENVWIGTSITGRGSVTRVKHLREIPAAHRYLSIEPLVEDPKLSAAEIADIDWMIVGGESDQGAMVGRVFRVPWAERIIALGQDQHVAVFIKQLGTNPEGLHLADHHGGDWLEWPAKLRVRQMPFTCA